MRRLAFGGAAVVLAVTAVTAAPNYLAIYDKGMPFDQFLESTRTRRADWHERFANAAVDADSISRIRAIDGRRKILVVAEDRCSDSAQSIPYIAKLAAAVPEKLQLRVVSSTVGRSVMEEHLTPDGRPATPTIVVLSETGAFIGAWSERPAELQKWVVENKDKMNSDDLHERIAKWYADDAGKSAVREIVDLIAK